MRMYRKLVLMAVLLILLVPQESNASLIGMFRKLAQGHNPKEKPIQMAPSPSPVSSSGGDGVDNLGKGGSGDGPAPANSPKAEPIGSLTDERCEMSFYGCKDMKNMTACLPYTGNGLQGSFLLVQNDGESSLKVNFTILPVDITFEEIELSKHQAKKVNISASVAGSQSIVLNAGHGDCVIHTGSPAPENYYKQFPSYATYVNPIHGAYLLFLTALIIGGTWACCKFSKKGQHLDGIPYQELEMGQPESLSAMNVETPEGWDQGWDDGWDEEKAMKSPGGNHVGNGRANALTSRTSNSDGWGNDWDA